MGIVSSFLDDGTWAGDDRWPAHPSRQLPKAMDELEYASRQRAFS
jgi:hypothetical protein